MSFVLAFFVSGSNVVESAGKRRGLIGREGKCILISRNCTRYFGSSAGRIFFDMINMISTPKSCRSSQEVSEK